MLALLSRQPGGPETLMLESVAEPRPKLGEVLLAVRACGVNYPDALIIEDRYQFKPERPFAPGSEGSGIIEAVGKGVTFLKIGDRVIGSCGWGAFTKRDPKANAANIRELLDLYARGTIKPVISARVPLARAGEAIAALSTRKAMGKIVVTMDGAGAS